MGFQGLFGLDIVVLGFSVGFTLAFTFKMFYAKICIFDGAIIFYVVRAVLRTEKSIL